MRPENGEKETAAQNAVQRFRDAGSGQLPAQPVGNVQTKGPGTLRPGAFRLL